MTTTLFQVYSEKANQHFNILSDAIRYAKRHSKANTDIAVLLNREERHSIGRTRSVGLGFFVNGHKFNRIK